jgi:hypothetical protein
MIIGARNSASTKWSEYGCELGQQSRTQFGIQYDKAIMTQKARRNEPCPCGSGKKYKRCCGRISPSAPELSVQRISSTSWKSATPASEFDKLNKGLAARSFPSRHTTIRWSPFAIGSFGHRSGRPSQTSLRTTSSKFWGRNGEARSWQSHSKNGIRSCNGTKPIADIRKRP